ncbi:hypothetical protein [Bradyrhizobium japonicum]|uniref:hypothetical protein n=1 Tax=Bradyrhizobium japonicum TaxID=375 RepID=UPI0012BD2DCE|nr:hypothetical protein [Bradyrhizobium japonicum]
MQLHARAGSVAELPYDVEMGGDMGYFQGLTSSSFKTTEDGRRLFFPWGVLGRGYLVGSEEKYGRLRKQMKTYIVVSVLLIVVAPSLFRGYNLGVSAALAGVCLAFYLTWMCILLPSLNPTDEGLSFEGEHDVPGTRPWPDRALAPDNRVFGARRRRSPDVRRPAGQQTNCARANPVFWILRGDVHSHAPASADGSLIPIRRPVEISPLSTCSAGIDAVLLA